MKYLMYVLSCFCIIRRNTQGERCYRKNICFKLRTEIITQEEEFTFYFSVILSLFTISINSFQHFDMFNVIWCRITSDHSFLFPSFHCLNCSHQTCFWILRARGVALRTEMSVCLSSLWSRLKRLLSCWTDCDEMWFRRSCSPQDEP